MKPSHKHGVNKNFLLKETKDNEEKLVNWTLPKLKNFSTLKSRFLNENDSTDEEKMYIHMIIHLTRN